jgi:hypothetical protein
LPHFGIFKMLISNSFSPKREFSGALSAAIITLPMAVAYGVTAFDSLGPAFRPQAALIGLNAAISTFSIAPRFVSSTLFSKRRRPEKKWPAVCWST